MTYWFALPPEIHSILLNGGVGGGSLLGGSSAWSNLSRAYTSIAQELQLNMSRINAGIWEGPSAQAYVRANEPFIAWLDLYSGYSTLMSEAYESLAANHATAVLAMPTMSELITNHVVHAILVATNFFGINTIPIAINEAQYSAMWIQAASTMEAYDLANTLITDTLPQPQAAPNISKLANSEVLLLAAQAFPVASDFGASSIAAAAASAASAAAASAAAAINFGINSATSPSHIDPPGSATDATNPPMFMVPTPTPTTSAAAPTSAAATESMTASTTAAASSTVTPPSATMNVPPASTLTPSSGIGSGANAALGISRNARSSTSARNSTNAIEELEDFSLDDLDLSDLENLVIQGTAPKATVRDPLGLSSDVSDSFGASAPQIPQSWQASGSSIATLVDDQVQTQVGSLASHVTPKMTAPTITEQSVMH